MAKMYLRGSDVETEATRQRARLQGINNETYVYYCNQLGNEHYPNCQTMYCFALKEKMEAVFDENNEPVLDVDGLQIYQGLGEFCLEVDTEQVEHSSLPSVHINRLVSRETMITDGWFEDET